MEGGKELGPGHRGPAHFAERLGHLPMRMKMQTCSQQGLV